MSRVADVSAERRAFAAKAGVEAARAVADFRQALPHVDAVDLVTPADNHLAVAKRLIGRDRVSQEPSKNMQVWSVRWRGIAWSLRPFRALAEACCHHNHGAVGSWESRRPSLGSYVTGTGATRGVPAAGGR